MKLLHIISSLKRGGAETLLCSLAIQLKNKGYAQEVIYFHDGPMVECLRAAGIPLHRVTGLLTRYDPSFWFRLWRTIKKINPDVIHSWLWAANLSSRLIGRLMGIPVINAMHNNVDQDGLVRNSIDKLTLPLAHKVVAVSDGVAQSITTISRLKPAQLTTIPNGIDIDIIRVQAEKQKQTRQAFGLQETDFVIGSVGRFVPLKNYPRLVRSFALVHKQHPHARLILAGTGPDEQALRLLAKNLDLNDAVRFIINQPAYGLYSLFDCFVMSSFKEGISMALLEAMACGLPCIVTNPTQKHDVLTHECDGIIVDSSTDKALAQAIVALMSNNHQRSMLGKNALETLITKFDFKSMAEKYTSLYQ